MIKPYRNEVVQQIKEAGQELIDRAESLVGEGLTEIADIQITIHIGAHGHAVAVPSISIQTKVLIRNTMDRWCDK